jgi:3-methyladenine DNA glycosylase Mpg
MEGKIIKKSEIEVGPRIGIKKARDRLWNFSVKKEVIT